MGKAAVTKRVRLTAPSAPAVPKMPTGIGGFDEITGGGLPRGRTTLVMGGAGCGKTVFALHTLVEGARHAKEAGLFVAFEESAARIVANAATFGWDLPRLTKKKLFTGHSNQVRELTLTDDGVTLTDVFVAQGQALMGVARWEWEQREQAANTQNRAALKLKQLQLELAQAEAAARLQVVRTEMEARSAEIEVLTLASGQASKLRTTDRAVLRKMRHADAEPAMLPRPRRPASVKRG